MGVIRNLREPILLRVICIISIIVGLFLCYSYDKKYFGFILLIVSLGVLISTSVTTGIEIFPEKNLYRKISSFFGIQSGTWNKIPESDYLSVLKSKQSKQFVGSGPLLTNDTFLINSFKEDRKPYTIYQTDDKSEAIETAKKIALILKISVLDTTEKEQKWLT